jgi:hypothetical protein
MGSAAVALSTPLVIGLVLFFARKNAKSSTVAVLGVMFGVAIAGTAIGAVSLLAGKTVVEMAAGTANAVNQQLGGQAAAVVLTPQLALLVILIAAVRTPKASGNAVAIFGIILGTLIAPTALGGIARQANKATTDVVGGGVNSVGQQLGGGGTGEAPPAGPAVGVTVGNGG